MNSCGWKRCHFYSKCVKRDATKCECSSVTSDVISPVCGSDGKSYNNLAALELAACQEQKWIVPQHSGRCITGKSHNEFIETSLLSLFPRPFIRSMETVLKHWCMIGTDQALLFCRVTELRGQLLQMPLVALDCTKCLAQVFKIKECQRNPWTFSHLLTLSKWSTKLVYLLNQSTQLSFCSMKFLLVLVTEFALSVH